MRHAVYFAPAADHPLWRAGCAWLGRDLDGVGAGRPARAGVEAPWRYGFHATLSAPMRLADGTTVEAWRDALRRFAAARHAFPMPPLAVDRLGDFLAVRPRDAIDPDGPLQRLADDCVEAFDAWRAPLDDAERQRQMRPGLTPEQRDLVERYGYPYVKAHWRFHMTLSGGLAERDPAAFERCRVQALPHFAAALAVPLVCDAVCWFVEPVAGAPFELRERFAFGG